MNDNIKSTIEEFKGYLIELPTASPERRKKIRHEAEVCEDLMKYSYLVADIESNGWKLLDSLVGKVMIATN